MPIDYKKDRERQEDIGFKTAAFVAGMCHYFSASFIINILVYANNTTKNNIAIFIVLLVNFVVFGGLFLYSYFSYHIKGIGKNVWKVARHEIFPFILCFFIDIMGGA